MVLSCGVGYVDTIDYMTRMYVSLACAHVVCGGYLGIDACHAGAPDADACTEYFTGSMPKLTGCPERSTPLTV